MTESTHSSVETRSPATTPRLSEFILEHLLVLPASILIALVWVNIDPETYVRFTRPLTFAVNDVAMVFFFGLITKEVVEARAPRGVLHSWRGTLLPVVISVGAIVAPALLHVGFADWIDEPVLSRGWPVATAIDVAFSYFVVRIIFGRHQVIPFLLLIALTANAIGFVILTFFYPTRDLHVLGGLVLLAAAVGVVIALRRARVKSFWPYILLGGALSWTGLYWGGAHPALALLFVMPFLPHAARDPGLFVDAVPGAKDALSRFEQWAKYPAQVALFFFGLVNAGVPFGALEPGTYTVPFASLIGKPVGLLVAGALAAVVGLRLPSGVTWRDVTVVGCAATISLTMGLFFTPVVIDAPGQLLNETRMGALLTIAGLPLALGVAKVLGVGKR
jgi:NhaA family Na+:H+ antiporter